MLNPLTYISTQHSNSNSYLIYSLALPPFPPFPGAAYGASLLGNIMYRGGNLAQIPHNRGTGTGMQRVSGAAGMARGFDNCKYHG